MPEPTVSTEWASSLTALSLQPTVVHRDRGWDTDDGTESGVADKPTLQHQNAWQANVHKWLQYISADLDDVIRIPTGTVMSVATNITGSYPVPPSGTVTDGWMLCDGAAIPVGQLMTGNTPDLSGDVFLMGSTVAGVTGGQNLKTMSEAETPLHDHGDGSYATSRSGNFSASNHTHNVSTEVLIYFGNNQFTPDIYLNHNLGASTWTSNFRAYTTTIVGSNTSGRTSFLKAHGNVDGPSATASIGGSNQVTGSSGVTGSSTQFDLRPIFISTQYLIKVTQQ